MVCSIYRALYGACILLLHTVVTCIDYCGWRRILFYLQSLGRYSTICLSRMSFLSSVFVCLPSIACLLAPPLALTCRVLGETGLNLSPSFGDPGDRPSRPPLPGEPGEREPLPLPVPLPLPSPPPLPPDRGSDDAWLPLLCSLCSLCSLFSLSSSSRSRCSSSSKPISRILRAFSAPKVSARRFRRSTNERWCGGTAAGIVPVSNSCRTTRLRNGDAVVVGAGPGGGCLGGRRTAPPGDLGGRGRTGRGGWAGGPPPLDDGDGSGRRRRRRFGEGSAPCAKGPPPPPPGICAVRLGLLWARLGLVASDAGPSLLLLRPRSRSPPPPPSPRACARSADSRRSTASFCPEESLRSSPTRYAPSPSAGAGGSEVAGLERERAPLSLWRR